MYNFSDKYKDICFYAWFGNDRPFSTKLKEIIPVDENGKKPNAPTLTSWLATYGWEQRADALDGQTTLSLDNSAIQKRLEAYKQIEEVGNQLLEAGKKYLEENPIQKEETAIRAIVEGAEMIIKSAGVADAIARVSQMSNTQLDTALKRLVAKTQNNIEYIDTVSNEENEDEVDDGGN